MRNIQFRAWDKGGKRMLNDPKMGFIEGNYNYPINDGFKDEDYVFMQFTGIKDKNKKDIYEGDIILWSGKQYVIEWHPKIAGFVMQHNGIERPDIEYDCEIVGNIYENPDLLTHHA